MAKSTASRRSYELTYSIASLHPAKELPCIAQQQPVPSVYNSFKSSWTWTNSALTLIFASLLASTMLFSLERISTAILALRSALLASSRICTIPVAPQSNDAVPAILSAFSQCSHDATIIFKNDTYYINSVMNTTGLSNVTIDLQGTLLWSTDIDYWLKHSLPVGYQNQSVAWYLGGSNITFSGHGYGTLDGNGQVWYDYNAGAPTLPVVHIRLAFARLRTRSSQDYASYSPRWGV